MNDIAKLLPHAGDSILIERVVGWDEEHIRVATTLHRSVDNPLRRHGHLAAVHLVEFAAQAMALHGGLRDQAAGRPPRAALLVSVRDLVLHREHLEKLDGELEILAHALMIDPQSWQYGFTVRHAGSEIASGRIAAMAQAGG
jgi:predicted hotdog family 3-hydroxylacyl-ACP dehydratase